MSCRYRPLRKSRPMQKRILNPLTENEPSRVESVQREIVRVCATMERAAIYGVAATLLSTGETVLVRADELFPTASVIKVSIVAELHAQAAEGRLNLDTPVTIRPEDIMAGSGCSGIVDAGLVPSAAGFGRADHFGFGQHGLESLPCRSWGAGCRECPNAYRVGTCPKPPSIVPSSFN